MPGPNQEIQRVSYSELSTSIYMDCMYSSNLCCCASSAHIRQRGLLLIRYRDTR